MKYHLARGKHFVCSNHPNLYCVHTIKHKIMDRVHVGPAAGPDFFGRILVVTIFEPCFLYNAVTLVGHVGDITEPDWEGPSSLVLLTETDRLTG